VQTAQVPDQLVSGPQEQVIRVCEDDAGIQIVFQIALRDSLDRRLRADRHEHGRLHNAVRRMQ